MASIHLIPLILEPPFGFCRENFHLHANACHSELVKTSLLALVFLHADSCFSPCIFHDCIVILTCCNNRFRWGSFFHVCCSEKETGASFSPFFLLDRGIFVQGRLQAFSPKKYHRAFPLSPYFSLELCPWCGYAVVSHHCYFQFHSWVLASTPSLAMPFTAIIHTGPSKVAIGHTPNLLWNGWIRQ